MDWSSNPLFETAFALGRAHAQANPRGRALPPLLFLTDPDRTPEPWRQAERLPEGAGVVLRWFGRPDSPDIARRLSDLCRSRGLVFLVGADTDLAEACGSDGVHLPERDSQTAQALRLRRPDWLITGAAHSAEALASAISLDAVLISPVFESASPSAGAPLGVALLRRLTALSPVPAYALGGVTASTAPHLIESGVCGLATVGSI